MSKKAILTASLGLLGLATSSTSFPVLMDVTHGSAATAATGAALIGGLAILAPYNVFLEQFAPKQSDPKKAMTKALLWAQVSLAHLSGGLLVATSIASAVGNILPQAVTTSLSAATAAILSTIIFLASWAMAKATVLDRIDTEDDLVVGDVPHITPLISTDA